ncbi:unnamed protein product, partial [marine sediment metagenome]
TNFVTNKCDEALASGKAAQKEITNVAKDLREINFPQIFINPIIRFLDMIKDHSTYNSYQSGLLCLCYLSFFSYLNLL